MRLSVADRRKVTEIVAIDAGQCKTADLLIGAPKAIRKEDRVVLKTLSTFPLLAFVLLIEPLRAIAQETPQPRSMPPPEWYWHGPWQGAWHGSSFWWVCPLMMLFMFLVFGAIIFFGRRRHWGPPWHMMDGGWGSPTHSALQTLNERFARGEIEKDEYEDKKAVLLSGGHH
ncbi:MAG: SHOCT domain-containing protein [Rhodospirillales bacterium]|nr:MAG: SHOCT domain-containing protein [Rhodospirillales bacterium]